jgi:hypothetical protein
MKVINFILRLLGWMVTIILQIAVSFLIIFLFSVIFSGVGSISRLDWLGLLFYIWLGYVIGINLVGYVSLRWAWKYLYLLPTQRLLGSMIGAFIPLLILLPIGYSVPVGDSGSRFYDLVSNNWQPILAQVSLFASLIGYYVPSVLKPKVVTK